MSASSSANVKFAPFANDADALALGELNVENHTDHVAIFGNLEIRRDAQGLRQAQALKEVLEAVVAALSGADLPAQAETPGSTTARQVKNPFES
ncbi:hypothetical protein [Pandoraea fibrosis]|uniref:Uncharacterized protein n=1 Tax=Pandoraea fibrosis TaxID=1891094 RepID=A0A5E4SPX0_9BURK|nr:hypothetical protein [Pandoraea fibrosis]QHE91884.1 hypothetical protein PJ20_008720 [Pandoraea fibrosis]QHF14559.1 hypothetical protein PI93_019280 [Pandoraea fibrosis]VVD77485.1 hypothetical protein PFI31113_00931 [Pandoraea fibrosis]